MSEIIPFAFDNFQIRTIERDGEPWFVLADVCRVTGIRNAAQAAEALDEDERGICSTYTPGGEQSVIVVSEGGLYTILLRSRKATEQGTIQHRFRRWITHDLLPTLRKRGVYALRSPERTISPPQDRDEHADHHFRYRLRQEFARIDAQWARDAPPGAKPWTIANTLFRSKQAFQRVVGIQDMPDHDGFLMGETEMRKKHFERFYQLGVDVDYVFTGRRTLSADEREMLDAYRHASPADRADARAMFERLPDHQTEGKLMSLDADLKSGMIGRREHDERRQALLAL